MTYYNDPLLVAAAVGVLLLFRRVRFSSRAVNSLAASALAVYLFQSSAWPSRCSIRSCGSSIRTAISAGYFVDNHRFGSAVRCCCAGC